MAGNIKHFLVRDGRYYALLVVPKNLRPYMDKKSELRTPLGADRRAALRAHPMAVAELMHQITQAERRKSEALGVAVAPGRYPQTDAQIALRSYRDRLAQDEATRNQSAQYAQVGIDDGYLHNLREGIAGRLGDAALIEIVGHRVGHCRNLGNTTAPISSIG